MDRIKNITSFFFFIIFPSIILSKDVVIVQHRISKVLLVSQTGSNGGKVRSKLFISTHTHTHTHTQSITKTDKHAT